MKIILQCKTLIVCLGLTIAPVVLAAPANVQLFVNSFFSQGLTGWSTVKKGAEDAISAYECGRGPIYCIGVDSVAPLTAASDIQVYQVLDAVNGQRYSVGFSLNNGCLGECAGYDTPQVQVSIQKSTSPYTVYGRSTCTVATGVISGCAVTANVTETTKVKFGIQGANTAGRWVMRNSASLYLHPTAGVNLLTNPSFAGNLNGWSKGISFPLEDKILYSATGGDGMGSSARFYSDGTVNSVADLQLYQALPVLYGQKYTLAFDVATTGTGNRNVVLFVKENDGLFADYATAVCAVPGTGVKRCTLTATIPGSLSAPGAMTVRFGIEGGDNLNDFTIDNASLIYTP